MFGMNEKLKPCPFCGGNAYLRTVGEIAYIECQDCECQTKYYSFKDKEKIIKIWNKRPDPWHTELPSESGDYVVWCCDHMALGPGGDPSKGNRLCIASYNSESETFVNEYDDEMGFLDVKTWWGQKIDPYKDSKENKK